MSGNPLISGEKLSAAASFTLYAAASFLIPFRTCIGMSWEQNGSSLLGASPTPHDPLIESCPERRTQDIQGDPSLPYQSDPD
jgi:hypothetical protein